MASVRILHVSHLPLRPDHRAALEEAAGSADLDVESATPRPYAELIALVQQRQPNYVASLPPLASTSSISLLP